MAVSVCVKDRKPCPGTDRPTLIGQTDNATFYYSQIELADNATLSCPPGYKIRGKYRLENFNGNQIPGCVAFPYLVSSQSSKFRIRLYRISGPTSIKSLVSGDRQDSRLCNRFPVGYTISYPARYLTAEATVPLGKNSDLDPEPTLEKQP